MEKKSDEASQIMEKQFIFDEIDRIYRAIIQKKQSNMKNLILLTLSFILFPALHAQEATSINWNEDLDFLAKELPEKHYDLFATRSEKEFSDGIDAIKAAAEGLTDIRVALKAQQLIARFGDSHTRLDFSPLIDKNKMLPLGVMWLKDGLYIVKTATDYKDILGCRLTAINEVPIATVIDSLSTLNTIDNRAVQKVYVPSYLANTEFLELFGFLPNGQITLSLRTPAGKDIPYDIRPTLIKKDNSVSFEPEAYSFCNKNRKLLFTDFYNPDEQIYYLQYNQCYSRELAIEFGQKDKAATLPSFKEFEEKVFDVLNHKPVSKIIFDLRFNGGGSSAQGTAFIEKLSGFLDEHPQVRTYVVIGRYTFSSAILNAMDFKKMTNAIFVGEETAGKPNHYGEVRSFVLPTSKLYVNYSTNYFKTAEEAVNTLTPDVVFEESFSDFAKGKDPVYEWVRSSSGEKRLNGWYHTINGVQDSLAEAPIVTVADFETVRLDSAASITQQGKTVYQITGKVKDSCVKTWADATEQATGRFIAFVYDNKVITSPTVNARIESGNFAISSYDGVDMKSLYKSIQEEMKNAELSIEHKKAWAEAHKLRASMTDTTFLKTKRPMSDDAIGPYNYHTGFIEDRAYNQTVYLIALDRTQKYISAENNQLVLNLKSGSEIHIAEDLFEYIKALYENLNKEIEEGKFKIIKDSNGYYSIEPVTLKKTRKE